MAYWWDSDSSERFWVEIRRRPGIGTSLWSPSHDEAGHRNGWYELVSSVRRGDTIYHYSARESRFVGRSTAAEDAVEDPVEESYSVELNDFTPIVAGVDLAYLRAKADEIYAVRDRLLAAYGPPLYLPFQFTRDRARLGGMSNYFAKMPVELVQMFFGPDGLAGDRVPLLPPAPGEDPPAAGDDRVPGPSPPVGFLVPFRRKADSDYMVKVLGGRRTRSRPHERIVNDCASWLESLGFEPMRNAAVDLGLQAPSMIIEAEVIGRSWAASIREAVGQLYEYRYFNVADPDADLMFLASQRVPDGWIEYLERDRGIGCIWSFGGSFELSPRAEQALGV